MDGYNGAIWAFNFIRERYKDISELVPASIDFANKCDNLYFVLEPLMTKQEVQDDIQKLHAAVLNEKSDEDVQRLLRELASTYTDRNKGQFIFVFRFTVILCKSRKVVDKLVQKDKYQRNKLDNIKYAAWKLWNSGKYYSFFDRSLADLNELIRIIKQHEDFKRINEGLSVSNILSKLYGSNEDAVDFWKIVGKEPNPMVADWKNFTHEYRESGYLLNERNAKILKQILCLSRNEQDNGVISIYTFRESVIKYGFPFDLTGIPSENESIQPLTRDGQLQLAIQISQLMKEYSDPEVNTAITAIIKQFKGDNGQGLKFYQWAINCKEARAKGDDEGSSSIQHQALKLDEYRRKWSFLYQRYMILWKLGRLSREMFADVDFPGKARIKTFIRHVEVMDYYNFTVVMESPETEWDKKRPQVYDFLRQWLAESGCEVIEPVTEAIKDQVRAPKIALQKEESREESESAGSNLIKKMQEMRILDDNNNSKKLPMKDGSLDDQPATKEQLQSSEGLEFRYQDNHMETFATKQQPPNMETLLPLEVAGGLALFGSFLCHRGTCKSFVVRVYDKLAELGLRPFIDLHCFKGTENVKNFLYNNVIPNVGLCSIVFFTKDFTESKFCVGELDHILDWKSTARENRFLMGVVLGPEVDVEMIINTAKRRETNHTWHQIDDQEVMNLFNQIVKFDDDENALNDIVGAVTRWIGNLPTPNENQLCPYCKSPTYLNYESLVQASGWSYKLSVRCISSATHISYGMWKHSSKECLDDLPKQVDDWIRNAKENPLEQSIAKHVTLIDPKHLHYNTPSSITDIIVDVVNQMKRKLLPHFQVTPISLNQAVIAAARNQEELRLYWQFIKNADVNNPENIRDGLNSILQERGKADLANEITTFYPILREKFVELGMFIARLQQASVWSFIESYLETLGKYLSSMECAYDFVIWYSSADWSEDYLPQITAYRLKEQGYEVFLYDFGTSGNKHYGCCNIVFLTNTLKSNDYWDNIRLDDPTISWLPIFCDTFTMDHLSGMDKNHRVNLYLSKCAGVDAGYKYIQLRHGTGESLLHKEILHKVDQYRLPSQVIFRSQRFKCAECGKFLRHELQFYLDEYHNHSYPAFLNYVKLACTSCKKELRSKPNLSLASAFHELGRDIDSHVMNPPARNQQLRADRESILEQTLKRISFQNRMMSICKSDNIKYSVGYDAHGPFVVIASSVIPPSVDLHFIDDFDLVLTEDSKEDREWWKTTVADEEIRVRFMSAYPVLRHVECGRCIRSHKANDLSSIRMATAGLIVRSKNNESEKVWVCSAGHVLLNADILACANTCLHEECPKTCIACANGVISQNVVVHGSAMELLEFDIGAFEILQQPGLCRPLIVSDIQNFHGRIPDIQALNGVGSAIVQPRINATVFKRGSRTNWTVGRILLIQGRLIEIVAVDEAVIPLSDFGDSGALWFQIESNQACPVAIHVAGESKRNRAVAILCADAFSLLAQLLEVEQIDIDTNLSYVW